jgi:hypothetical protein
MATPAKVKWTIEADYLQACNCDYGCPCEFEAPPTKGFCEGVGAWRINRGSYGNVSLNGLGLGFALHSPAALHLGNITLALFVDQRANQQQRDSLVQIASGQAGGMPFEIIASLVSKLSGPHFVPIQFTVQGKNSSAKIGNVASMGFEPIKNPVTGEPESIRIEHGTGFLFKGADVVSAKECRSSVTDLSFSWPNKSGFVTQVKYGN